MSDLYLEELVKRKHSLKHKLISFGLIGVAFVLWIQSYLWFGSLIFFIPAIIVTVLGFVLIPRLNVEWEYTYVSAELDVDKIYNRSKRKRIGTYAIKKAEIIAPANSHRLDYYNNNKKMTVVDCSSQFEERAKNVYAMIIETEKKELQKLLFEPSEEMLNDMRMRAPRTVFMD